jgi:hypothetical protein
MPTDAEAAEIRGRTGQIAIPGPFTAAVESTGDETAQAGDGASATPPG